MDYSQLSDFEINLKVAHIVLGKQLRLGSRKERSLLGWN